MAPNPPVGPKAIIDSGYMPSENDLTNPTTTDLATRAQPNVKKRVSKKLAGYVRYAGITSGPGNGTNHHSFAKMKHITATVQRKCSLQ